MELDDDVYCWVAATGSRLPAGRQERAAMASLRAREYESSWSYTLRARQALGVQGSANHSAGSWRVRSDGEIGLCHLRPKPSKVVASLHAGRRLCLGEDSFAVASRQL